MTIAIACANRDVEDPGVWVAADTRLTMAHDVYVETFVKAMDLGNGVGLVVAGSTLPATAAAEIVRPLILNHNRRESAPVSFIDTCHGLGPGPPTAVHRTVPGQLKLPFAP